jgi:hypothetical protein
MFVVTANDTITTIGRTRISEYSSKNTVLEVSGATDDRCAGGSV